MNLIIIVLIAIILVVLLSRSKKIYHEGFSCEYVKDSDIRWEAKFPSMVKQRYSYNDTPLINKTSLNDKRHTCSWREVYRDDRVYDKPAVIPDSARLKELPLNMVNIWGTECGYYPDLTKLNCQPNYQGLAELQYTPYDCASLTSKIVPISQQ